MSDINLLPQSQKQKRLSVNLMTYISIGFFAILVILAGFVVALTTVRITIAEKINSFNNQIETIENKTLVYKDLESNVSSANTGLKAIKTILDKQIKPNTILDQISAVIGSDVIIKTITVNKTVATTTKSATPAVTAAPVQITIGGTAKQRSSIVDFKRALENNAAFTGITYTITADTSVDTTAPFTFTLNAGYQTPKVK
ncbi:MAG: PilN domain-containing protein [Patescibacteria group bacterium]|jgi:Tfp pilus assembly protein PilN